MSAVSGAAGGTLPPGFSSKSAQSHENKRVVIFATVKKCKKMQKSAQESEKKGIVGGGVVSGEEGDTPTPPITCMIFKRKDLQNGQFVND